MVMRVATSLINELGNERMDYEKQRSELVGEANEILYVIG